MPVLVRYDGAHSWTEPSNVINLMDALRDSLKGERGGGRSQTGAKRSGSNRRAKSASRRRKAA